MWITIVFFITTLCYFFKRWQKDSKLPPGPKRIPILGSLPFINTGKGLLDWALDPAVTENDISRVDIGPISFFVINNISVAKQLFDKAEFSGKTASKYLLEHRFFHRIPQGVIHTQGKQWETTRRFSLKTLKDFGFGKSSLDDMIHLEVQDLIQEFLQVEGDFLVGNDFNVPIINVLWKIIADSRFTKEDPESIKVVGLVTKLFEVGLKTSFIPLFLLKLFPHLTEYAKKRDCHENIKSYLMKVAEEHREVHDASHPRDFIDIYLTEIEKDETGEKYSMEELVSCMMDFFNAGTETSSTTLKWSVLFFTLHQDVQQRCRDEICRKLGTSSATISHMASLPFTMATIAEIQRVSRVAPMSLPHTTTKVTQVEGFTFPKKSTFMTNISHIMNDPAYFDQPHVFNPSRFIGSDGRFIKNERMIPFGIGKRYCMGELLARNEIFLFIVSLLQNIHFDLPQEHPPPNPQNYLASLTRMPSDFYVKMTKITK